MDLSEVVNGFLCVLLQKEGHQKCLWRAVLAGQSFPWSLLVPLSTRCSLGYNTGEWETRAIPGNSWLLYWAITGLQQKAAVGHLGKVSFGDDVCICCVQLCPKTRQGNTATRSETQPPVTATLCRRLLKDTMPAPREPSFDGRSPPSRGCVFCFREWGPVQLNLLPAQRVSGNR